MDSDQVKAQLTQIQEQAQAAAAQAINDESETLKRRIWRDYSLLKMSVESNTLKVSQDVKERFTHLEKELFKDLSLRPHCGRSGGVLGITRLIAFVLMTFLMFPVFVAGYPLRWLHPVLRKLGVRNHKLPFDYIPKFWGLLSILIFGIQARYEGLEHVKEFADNGTSMIGFFQHSSFFDFIGVIGTCNIFFKWVSKRSLYLLPILGQMGYIAGMIPIDRTNFESAKKSLEYAAHVAQKYKRAIAIAPEGTRSTNGELAEFKKGAFHLALQCQVPSAPMVLFGAYHCWPPHHLAPKPGIITVRFLKPLNPKDYLPDKYNQMLHDVRVVMLEAMANPPKEIVPRVSAAYNALSLSVTASIYAFTGLVTYGIYWYFQ